MKRTEGCQVWLWGGFVLGLLAAGNQKALTASAAGPVPLRYEEPKSLTGSIYSVKGHKLLYRFSRSAKRSNTTLEVQRTFTYPDGKPAATERVRYEGNALTSYELGELQIGAAGRAGIHYGPGNEGKGTIEFEYASEPGARPKLHTEALAPDTLVGDMVGPFLASNWDALDRGERLKCRYVAIPRRETVGFTFLKDSSSTWQGHKVVVVKMEPTSRFVAMLVDPLFFTVERDPPHRVLRYLGRTTPKILVQGKWKDLDAETVFDWDSAR